MRFILTAFAFAVGLALHGPVGAQMTNSPLTNSPSVSPPRPLEAPVGHRQPRREDVTTPPSGTDSSMLNADQDPSRPDPNEQRLNRIMNGICRGC
jgi:hypothetical protein